METAWINEAARMLQTLGWTLIHSLWQAAVVYALLSLLLKAAPGMPARVRYACGLAALGAIALWCLGTLYRHWPAPVAAIAVPYARAQSPAGVERSLLRALDEAMPWLMMAYGLGLGLMIGRMLLGFSEIRRMRQSGFPIDGELGEQLRTLSKRMGVKRSVALRQSPLVAVPMVIGALRPMILIPPSCLESLSPAALEALLLHELAHIRRADFVVNILQTVLEAVLFFNPFVRRISGLLRREREHCCDDLVLSHSAHRYEYAAALASLAVAGSQPALALAANDGRYPLLNRIKRITTMEKKSVRPGTVILVSGIAAVLVALSIACFTPAFAQRRAKTAAASSKPAPPAPPAPQSAATSPAPPAPPQPAPLLAEGDDLSALTKEAMSVGLDAADLALANMPEMMDSVMDAATQAVREIDWTNVRRELRNASKELKEVDWNAINKEIRLAMEQSMDEIDWDEVRGAIHAVPAPAPPAPPACAHAPLPPAVPQNQKERAQRYRERRQMTDEMRKDLAEARKEIEEARQEREAALAARHAERAQERSVTSDQREAVRERMEEARQEMEQARREMDRARQKLERAAQGMR